MGKHPLYPVNSVARISAFVLLIGFSLILSVQSAPLFYPAHIEYGFWGNLSDLKAGWMDQDQYPDLITIPGDRDEFCIMTNDRDLGFSLPDARCFATRAHAGSIAVDDFNRDGRMDVALTLGSMDMIEVFLQSGNGFPDPIPYATAGNPVFCVPFHAGGDMYPDLAVLCRDNHMISVLINDGSGTFPVREDHPCCINPSSLAVSDFSRDGLEDLAVSSRTDPVVQIHWNSTAGFAGDRTEIAVSGSGERLIDLDLNRDGFQDLVLTIPSTSQICLLKNLGDHRFDTPVYLDLPIESGINRVDLNLDEYPDLIVSGLHGIQLLFNQRNGTYAFPVEYNSCSRIDHIVSADFDRDGYPDVAASGPGDCPGISPSNSASILIFHNTGHSSLAEVPVVECENAPFFVTAADLNRDGIDEVAACHSGTNDVVIWSIRPDLGLVTQRRYDLGHQPFELACADLNDDLYPDLAVTQSDDTSIAVLINEGDGTFGTPQFTGTIGTQGKPIAADFNNDAAVDLAVAGLDNQYLYVFENDGSAGLTHRWEAFTGRNIFNIGYLRYDADSLNDIAWIGDILTIYVNGPGEQFTPSDDFVLDDGFPVWGDVADLNGDGFRDVAVAGDWYVQVYYSTGGRGFFDQKSYFPPGIDPRSVTCCDINHDSARDLLISSRVASHVCVMLNNLTPIDPFTVFSPYYGLESVPGPGIDVDLQGDGWSDFVYPDETNSRFITMINSRETPPPPPPPTPTPLPTFTPTMTPTPDCATGVEFEVPMDHCSPGDSYYMNISVCHRDPTPGASYPLFVILDAFGQYYFAPGFIQELDHYNVSFPNQGTGQQSVQVFDEFSWPGGAGSGSVTWYAGLTNNAITELYGAYDVNDFSWGD